MQKTAVKEVETRYQEFELHPEKHPLYPAEWEAFWNRRYKELQTEGKDPSSHDFKPEWIAFWIRRLKELFNADVEAAKRDIKIKLGLATHNSPSRSDSVESLPRNRDRERERRRSVDRRDRSPSNSSRGRNSYRRSSRSPSRSTVQSKRRLSRSPSLDRRERIRELDRIISRLPGGGGGGGGGSRGGGEYERGRDPYGYDYNYSSREHDRYRGSSSVALPYDREDTLSSTGVVVVEDDDDTEPITVVSVLRILSALEEQLGSLGAKTLDMLAKALAMEKAKANSADELMLSDNNAVFFETIKEKLKGQLIAGVLDKNKVNAAKKAIRKIAEILHEISKKTAEAAKAEKEADALKRTIVIKVNMDKAMIAQRIALALVTEKKTDVTPEQLEILINVFFEMLRKSKELNKMVTTQDYIDLLEEQRVQTVADQEDILGIIGKSEAKADKPVVKLNFDDQVLEEVETKDEAKLGAWPEEEEEDGFAKGGSGEGFTDSDLQTLLINFKDLSSDEQQHLIRHLRHLEREAPDRVEKLRKFVHFDDRSGSRGGSGGRPPLSMSEELSKRRSRWNEVNSGGQTVSENPAVASSMAPPTKSTRAVLPGSSRSIGGIPGMGGGVDEEKERVKFDMKKKELTVQQQAAVLLGEDDEDDDDDDYSLVDVVKAASKNLDLKNSRNNEGEQRRSGAGEKRKGDRERSVSPETKKITETHSLLANIMGSLQKKSAATASSGASGTSSLAALVGSVASGAGAGEGGSGNKQVGGNSNKNGSGGGKDAMQANAGSLPFYQQQNSNYKSTYQEQILQQQQQQQMMQNPQYMQYQQQMQGGGYDMQQQMMYNQQDNGGGGQWGWQQQQQPFNPQQQQQQFFGNNNYGGPQNQYPNNGQNQYGNYY